LLDSLLQEVEIVISFYKKPNPHPAQ